MMIKDDNIGKTIKINAVFNTWNNDAAYYKLASSNSTQFINFDNFSITDLNITSEHVNDFLQKLIQLNNFKNTSKTDNCFEYCSGAVRNALLAYKAVHGYISLLICILGTIANILNIIVLTRKEMTKTPINNILKWLAVADMFVLIEYIPFSTYMYIAPRGENKFKYSCALYLLFHMHFSQILHTISILLTVTLAIWRYIAIRHSHGRFATYLISHCCKAICLSFIISPILCFPTYFVFKIKERYFQDMNITVYYVDAREDTTLYSFNFWVHSVIVKLIPCFILTIISFILIRVLWAATKRKTKLKQYNTTLVCQTMEKRQPKCERRADRTTMLLVAVLLLFLLTEFPQGILGLLSGILQKCFLRRCYGLFGEIMDLLALINAAIGFVLYGLMSKQFRTSFKSLFIKTSLVRMETTRVTGLTTTCV